MDPTAAPAPSRTAAAALCLLLARRKRWRARRQADLFIHSFFGDGRGWAAGGVHSARKPSALCLPAGVMQGLTRETGLA